MRRIIAWSVCGLAACASGPSSGIETKPTSVSVGSESTIGQLRIETTDSPTTRSVATPLLLAWNALPAVYQALGLSITKIDTAQLVVRGQRLRSRQPFAGKQLGDLLNCGETAGIPNTLRYDVTMQLATQLRPAGDSTEVVTQVIATAKASGTAGDPVRCSSNGRIATGVADAVLAASKR